MHCAICGRVNLYEQGLVFDIPNRVLCAACASKPAWLQLELSFPPDR